MLLQRVSALCVHSNNDTIENLFEVFVQAIGPLEDLENDCQEDGALRVVHCDVGFGTEHALVCDVEKHLDSSGLIHESLSAIDHIVVERVHERITEAVFVLLEHLFQLWQDIEYRVRNTLSLLNEVLDNRQYVIFEIDFSWVKHIFENGDVGLFVLLTVLFHDLFVLCDLLQNVDAFLDEQSRCTIWNIFVGFKSYSLNQSLSDYHHLVI